MQKEMMVSVIMLAYNCENTIAQAIDSVLEQDVNFRYEILIGNDASTDGTKQILTQYEEQYPGRVICIHREQNVGAARNAFDLLMRSSGKYLAFCEGDDFWLDRRKLQTQVDFLERHPEYIGYAHRCLLVDEQGQPLKKQYLPWANHHRKHFRFRDFCGGRILPGQTATVVKRNLFRGSQEDWSILYRESKDVSDRFSNEVYLLRGDFYCTDEVFSAYRKKSTHGGKNTTSRLFKDNPNKCRDELTMTRAMEEYASGFLGKAVRFSKKRSDILTDALIELTRHRDREHLDMVLEMAEKSKAAEILCIPASAVRKIYMRIRT